jgi:hypothetical protein
MKEKFFVKILGTTMPRYVTTFLYATITTLAPRSNLVIIIYRWFSRFLTQLTALLLFNILL